MTSDMVPRGMANVLNKDMQQQVVALGQIGWTLRRIEEEALISGL